MRRGPATRVQCANVIWAKRIDSTSPAFPLKSCKEPKREVFYQHKSQGSTLPTSRHFSPISAAKVRWREKPINIRKSHEKEDPVQAWLWESPRRTLQTSPSLERETRGSMKIARLGLKATVTILQPRNFPGFLGDCTICNDKSSIISQCVRISKHHIVHLKYI